MFMNIELAGEKKRAKGNDKTLCYVMSSTRGDTQPSMPAVAHHLMANVQQDILFDKT